MRLAGIARLNIERDQTVLLQMQSGEVIGPIKVGDARRTLGTHIAWSARELGDHNARTLLEMLEPAPNAELCGAAPPAASKSTKP